MVKGVSMPPPRMVSKRHKVQKKSTVYSFKTSSDVCANGTGAKNYNGAVGEAHPLLVWVCVLAVFRPQ